MLQKLQHTPYVTGADRYLKTAKKVLVKMSKWLRQAVRTESIPEDVWRWLLAASGNWTQVEPRLSGQEGTMYESTLGGGRVYVRIHRRDLGGGDWIWEGWLWVYPQDYAGPGWPEPWLLEHLRAKELDRVIHTARLD